MRATISMDGLLSIIDSLSPKNKKWLANHLYEQVHKEEKKELKGSEATERFLAKHCGVWEDKPEIEKLYRELKSERMSCKEPLNFDL